MPNRHCPTDRAAGLGGSHAVPGVQLVSQKLGAASGVPHGNQQILMPAPWSNEKLRQGQVGRLGSHHLCSRLVVSFDFQGVVLAAVDR